jgi:hypothetical protein
VTDMYRRRGQGAQDKRGERKLVPALGCTHQQLVEPSGIAFWRRRGSGWFLCQNVGFQSGSGSVLGLKKCVAICRFFFSFNFSATYLVSFELQVPDQVPTKQILKNLGDRSVFGILITNQFEA